METQLIETPEHYASALKEIDGLMSAEVGSAEGRRLEILADLVQKYEAQHFAMPTPAAADDVVDESRNLAERNKVRGKTKKI